MDFRPTKLDRFARTAIDGVATGRSLFDGDIRVQVLNMGLIEKFLTGILILTVIPAFAEYARGMMWRVPRQVSAKAR